MHAPAVCGREGLPDPVSTWVGVAGFPLSTGSLGAHPVPRRGRNRADGAVPRRLGEVARRRRPIQMEVGSKGSPIRLVAPVEGPRSGAGDSGRGRKRRPDTLASWV